MALWYKNHENPSDGKSLRRVSYMYMNSEYGILAMLCLQVLVFFHDTPATTTEGTGDPNGPHM
jgi:hypothetical protein